MTALPILPQLRVRTEFSFRKAFGPIELVADRLAALGCSVAGCVDTSGTWAHAKWEKALLAREIEPLFGAEFTIACEAGRKPVCWALAEDTRAFYRLSSNPPQTQADWIKAKGAVRFCGAALTDPAAFDYIDLNPASMLQNARALALHRYTKKPLVLTSANEYPGPDDRLQFMAWVDNARTTPQTILGNEELRAAFGFLDDATYLQAYKNTVELGERLKGQRLQKAPVISVEGDLRALVEEGRQYRMQAGHISSWTEEYQARLDRELDMIEHKAFESYFIVVSDLVKWAKTKMLVGPARGSSAGSLVCYLLQITEVNPLPHGLLFERFIDINRDDLPDIDIDFNDKKRELCFDYLIERYGRENVARVGSINTLKPRSVINQVAKKLGIPIGATFPVVNVLVNYSSGDSRFGHELEDTLNDTKPGQDFKRNHPEAMIMGDLENHASHTGVHAAGILVSNEAVTEYCTVRDGVAQVDKKGAEYLNLLKIDALGLRTLGVIEDSGAVTSEFLYGLVRDDPEVFRIFNERKFSGVFQFEGAAQRSVSTQIDIQDFKTIDHVTALARPGPLGGGAADHYINRKAGREKVTYHHETMAEYLAETFGVVLYQEQVMRIVREIGGFSWEETSVIRKAMSGRKGKEFFDQRGKVFAEGAARLGIDEAGAKEIWDEICNFGAWGMNKSHTTSYAVISYWCAYMKRYHPLEYAAACLRNAKGDEQTVEILRELTNEGVDYLPFDPQLSEANWAVKDGKLVGGFENLVGIGPVKARRYIEKREKDGLSEKDLAAIAKCPVKNADLRPAHTLWGDIYAHPSNYDIRGPVLEFANLANFETNVVICKLVRKERRDENEALRVGRRGGKAWDGPSLFLDAFVVDDSVSQPIRMRVKIPLWDSIGEPLANYGVDGKDWFLVRGRWLEQFSMFIVQRIKCLTNPELFS